ncbi:MAG: hypothetical protein E4H48_04985 [Syntrophobacterales bacterium]|nr:MAG: hypothetical protein E4H48_04985 [Syntrophobacterales bacterium]
MRKIRRLVMWVALLALVALTILSIVGAFKGTTEARKLFNSIPMAVYWFAVVALLVAGLCLFKRLIRSPGLLAAHVGPLLILAGGMYSSDAGHQFARDVLGSEKTPDGYIPLRVTGDSSNELLDGSYRNTVGYLPFSLAMEKAWEEYYIPWQLVLVPAPVAREDGTLIPRSQELIDWAVGQEVALPHTAVTLKVLDYLPGSSPVYPKDLQGTLEVTGPDGAKEVRPAKLGQEVHLEKPKVTLQINKIFTRAVVHLKPSRHFTDTGSALNPALGVDLLWPDGRRTQQLAFAMYEQPHGENDSGIRLRYVLSEPTPTVGVTADPDSQAPAIKLEFRHNGRPRVRWLKAYTGDPEVGMSVDDFLGLAKPPASAASRPASAPAHPGLPALPGMPTGHPMLPAGHPGGETVLDPPRLHLTKPTAPAGENDRYLLVVQSPLVRNADGTFAAREQTRIEWAVGSEYPVPHTQAKLQVLEYLPAARPVYAEGGEPVLELPRPDGGKETLPAKVGQTLKLEGLNITLRIAQVYTHLIVRIQDGVHLATNDNTVPNPALKVELEGPDGSKSHQFVYARFPGMHTAKDALPLRYVVPEKVLTGVEADPGSSSPAMKLSLTHEGKQTVRWLVVPAGQPQTEMSLAEFATLNGAPDSRAATRPTSRPASQPAGDHDPHDGHDHGDQAHHSLPRDTRLYLVRPRGPIKDWKSSLAIVEEGRHVAHKVIELNHPLHYGGYHFYQYAFQSDTRSGRWTYSTIHVRSDSGMIPVYVGFFLLCAGVFWQFWLRPTWRYVKATTRQ